jgi:hypothetical protein
VSYGLPSLAQWTAGAYLGAAHTKNSALSLSQPALGTDLRFNPVSYRGESFRGPLYYGARVGYIFHGRWGVEGEFTHLKVFANVGRSSTVTGLLNGHPVNAFEPIETVVQRFSISHGVNLILANVVFREQLWRIRGDRSPRLTLVLRLGAGTTHPHAESTVEGHADEHYQLGSPAIQLGGGIELRVWHRLYWMGEYKFTRTEEQVHVFGGKVTSLLHSHHVVTGPTIHF